MYDVDDDDDLIGDLSRSSEPAYGYDAAGRPMYNKRGRRAGVSYVKSKAEPDPVVEIITVDRLTEVISGVSIPFLMQLFKLGRTAVTDRLLPINPVKYGKNSAPYYDLREAAAYLVDPKTDLDAYLSNLSPSDLPEHLRDTVWAAKLKEQRWKVNAGELWHTSDVQEVVGDLMRTVKTRTQIVIDTIDDKHELSTEQRDILKKVLNGMLADMRHDLKKQMSDRKTGSQLTGSDDA